MIQDVITSFLKPPSDFIYGFADLQGLLDVKYIDYKYGISIGKRLDDKVVDELKNGPTIEYLRHYKQVNSELQKIAVRIHDKLLESGYVSLPVIPTISKGSEGYDKFMENLSYDISHKMVATRAGLGWIGKSDLLISEKFGPRLRLVSILLKDDPGCCNTPVENGKCGKCRICVEKCPAKAATGESWNIHLHRDRFFDAGKCREKCAELAGKLLNTNERICGLCVSICPVGRKPS